MQVNIIHIMGAWLLLVAAKGLTGFRFPMRMLTLAGVCLTCSCVYGCISEVYLRIVTGKRTDGLALARVCKKRILSSKVDSDPPTMIVSRSRRTLVCVAHDFFRRWTSGPLARPFGDVVC